MGIKYEGKAIKLIKRVISLIVAMRLGLCNVL